MSKDKTITNTEEIADQEYVEEYQQGYPEDVPGESSKELFFFPNLGNPFSVQASSAKEAEAANTQYLEESKKAGK